MLKGLIMAPIRLVFAHSLIPLIEVKVAAERAEHLTLRRGRDLVKKINTPLLSQKHQENHLKSLN